MISILQPRLLRLSELYLRRNAIRDVNQSCADVSSVALGKSADRSGRADTERHPKIADADRGGNA